MTEIKQKTIRVVVGLILRQNHVLACQRREGSAFPLKWEFPGGKVEEGEGWKDALRRELREELAIEVERATEIFSHTHTYKEEAEVSLKFFRILKYGGEVQNRVFQQISWVEVGALGEMDFLEGDLPVIKKLVSADDAKLLA